MSSHHEHLTVLSEPEKAAFYECPDFNQEQRFEHFTLTDEELQIALKRQSLPAQVHCILQIGYFKAVKLFFRVTWDDVDPDDLEFILQQYFPEQSFQSTDITQYEYYAQCNTIASFFGYRTWEKDYLSLLYTHAISLIQRDIQPQFIALELLSYLNEQKIIRPGYTPLQSIVSTIINEERKRLTAVLQESLTPEDKSALEKLLINENSLSDLAAIKQDARNFKKSMMTLERDKWMKLKPLYQVIKQLLPTLKLSQQNIQYYADLAEYYTVYDLRKKTKTMQAHLYLLCYAWKRYREINDNLIIAFGFHSNQFEDSITKAAKNQFSEQIVSEYDSQYNESLTMKKLAAYWVDDSLPDDIQFGSVREKVFSIISREELKNKVAPPKKKSPQELDFYWKVVDSIGKRLAIHLRPLAMMLDFSSTTPNNPWLAAITWIKELSAKNKDLAQQSIDDCPEKTVPKSQKAYLCGIEDQSRVNATRYEFWVYRQLFNQWKTGHIFLEDSLLYRSLNQELVSLSEKDELIKALKIPAFDKPIEKQLDALLKELKSLWKRFNKALKKGELTHLRYDEKDKTLHLQKINLDKEEKLKHQLYGQLPLCDIADVLRFGHKSSNFFSAFTHIQPRYSKLPANEEHLIGTIIAQAMNNGNFNMAEISDIPYASLQDTLQSRLRLSTLKAACDLLTKDITQMSIFPLYSFDPLLLYAGVDGQKLEVKTSTLRARHSKKYYRKGKGLVAYTLLANHIPLQTQLIGANEHESYFAFDIWYNNTSAVSPDIVTGDMHLINRANFVLMHWFGGKLYPRFTNIDRQCKHLYAGEDRPEYAKYKIQPIGVIDRALIEKEWPNLQRIIATLGLKETTQSTLIKKLCTYKQDNETRNALFEFDKLIRSIHTLKCLLDPTIQRNTHRSQNRVEAYHQLRGAIAQAYGKKQLIGKTNSALEISNQCGRLVACAIIHYNSAILSRLYDKYKEEGNNKAIKRLKKISPVAWRHIHFQGHFVFSNINAIDLDKIIQNLILNAKPANIENWTEIEPSKINAVCA
jgi:TnpA family transposase